MCSLSGTKLNWWQRRQIPFFFLPLACCLLAAVLRLLLWAGPLHQPANDEIEYITVARDVLAGRGWVFYESYPWLRAPLYNLFLAGSLWLAGGDLRLAALPNIALSVANVYLAYLFALQLVGRRAALLAALLTAVLWTNVTFASLYMCETLFTFCFLVGMVAVVRCPLPVVRRRLFADPRPLTPGPSHRWFLIAGVFFALATLTRSVAMLFLPVIIVWLLFALRFRPIFQRFVPICLLLVAFCLTVSPWTIRNYLAYGRVIPVETGLAYNVWAFNEPRESLDTINARLAAIANPAERSDYALARGTARLREDPAILLRKLWPNWVYLTRVKPIEDRFVLESYYLDARLPLFSTALVLDDALYILIALAGIVGLASRGQGSGVRVQGPAEATKRWIAALRTPKALCALWVMYIVATMLLTHGEPRYRHFLFPVLIPYAAWALTRGQRSGVRGQEPKSRRGQLTFNVQKSSHLLVFLSSWLLFLAAFVPNYPYRWAADNLARGWQQSLGAFALARGDSVDAIGRYNRAAEIGDTADAYRRLGDVARQVGQMEQAEAAYRTSTQREILWVAPAASLGDLLREQGRDAEARAAYTAPYLANADLVDWAWRHVAPRDTPTIDVGAGLDYGYLAGVYASEIQQGATARWTNGDALLRLAPNAQPALLRLRLAAPHPAGAVPATVCVAAHCTTLALDRTWRTYHILLPPNPDRAPIEIRSATFDGGNGRTLGILIDTVRIAPATLAVRR